MFTCFALLWTIVRKQMGGLQSVNEAILAVVVSDFFVSFPTPNINPKLKWFFDLAHTLLDGKKRFCTLPSFRLAAHCHPSLPSALLHSSATEIGERSVGGEVDLCVLTLSSLLTNTHVAVTQSNQESGEGSWMEGTDVFMVEEENGRRRKMERKRRRGGEEVKEEPQQQEQEGGIIEEFQTKTEEETATGKG
ncbi:hypothetical protein BLNAU_5042 [Blattamonas nauphoetae]|uniref:Uncharacterized protein n=1 Tax=Blattamonas nauphoetae TaxID=2049346 RepID=A0ABQ9Y8X8_9EUKA|nr:hypothetical protein BLNAU_5042 [Blattamonas nauphoetae]